jgi:transposase
MPIKEGMGAPKKSDWREARRKRTWELYQQGWMQKTIAEALGVSQGAVSQWLKAGREGGSDALNAHPPTGRQSRLRPDQLDDLVHQLTKGAEAHGYAGDVWTTKRVVAIIARLYHVH